MLTSMAIAVTGSVGAGKSTVSKLFEDLGGIRIDADLVVAELWREKYLQELATERWGAGILNAEGYVVHSKVAAIIFQDSQEYSWLCGVLHPLVKKEIAFRVARTSLPAWSVVEIPLLFEAGVDQWVSATVFVTASWSVRLERCRARGWDEQEMERRERFFLPSEQRMALADYVIDNSGTVEELKNAVRRVYSAINLSWGTRERSICS